MEAKERYNVVFAGTGEPKSNVAGVMTWTSFRDEADFNQWLTEYKDDGGGDAVVAKGVSDTEAIKLCQMTPLNAREELSIQKATRPDGTVDQNILEMELETQRMALEHIVRDLEQN